MRHDAGVRVRRAQRRAPHGTVERQVAGEGEASPAPWPSRRAAAGESPSRPPARRRRRDVESASSARPRATATRCTASMIRPYPVQRQMLPDSSSRISVVGRRGDALEQGVRGHRSARACRTRTAPRRRRRRPAARRWRAVARRRCPRSVTIAWPTARRRQHEARAHQLAVDEDAARPALALLARPLAAEQAEPLAQHVQQALAQPRVGARRGDVPLTCSAYVLVLIDHRGTPVAAGGRPAPRPRGGGTPRVARWSSIGRAAAAASRPNSSTVASRDRAVRPVDGADGERLGVAGRARSSAPPNRARGAPTGVGRRRRGTPPAMAITIALRTPTLA